MIRAFVFVGVACVSFLAPNVAEACAGCSNPNLPSGRSSAGTLKPGQVSASFNLTATMMRVVHSEDCPDIGPICNERAEPPQLHDQNFYLGELRPIIELGLTKTFGVELQIPLRFIRSTIVFRRLTGERFTPDYENIHHRHETLIGFSDPWLSGKVAWTWGKTLLAAQVGVTVPLGRTEPNPFALGRAGLPHQHLQYGTGTFNPILGLDVVTTLGRFRLGGYGQVMLALYQNSHGYRAGNRYLGGISIGSEIVQKLRLALGSDVLNEQPERWDGVVQQDGNVGRTDILVGGTLSYPLGSVLISLSVKVPVWQQFSQPAHLHQESPGQLTYPGILNLSIAGTFDLLAEAK